jgi:hypothetical protein
MESKSGFRLTRIRDFFGVYRCCRVLVDHVEVGRIPYWSRKEFSCAPGSHRVQVAMDWCRSKPLTVEITAGRPVELECGMAFRGWWWYFGLLACIFAPHRVLFVREAIGTLPEPKGAEGEFINNPRILALIFLIALTVLAVLFIVPSAIWGP